MAENADPVLREIGRQLRDGQVRSRELLAVPDYWDALVVGYEKLRGIDFGEISERMDDVWRRESDEVEELESSGPPLGERDDWNETDSPWVADTGPVGGLLSSPSYDD